MEFRDLIDFNQYISYIQKTAVRLKWDSLTYSHTPVLGMLLHLKTEKWVG